MFGFRGGESDETVTRKTGYRIDAKRQWSGLTTLDLSEIKNEEQLITLVKVRYMGLDGKTQEVEANGLLATVLQHEIDHTNGVLFIDHISKLKRDRVIKKFTKAAKRADD